jgi:hypothetical protein
MKEGRLLSLPSSAQSKLEDIRLGDGEQVECHNTVVQYKIKVAKMRSSW